MKVLLVDDEIFSLKLLAHQLTQLGYEQVSSCENGAEALLRIEVENENPDLIFCDLQMPQMDGVEFVRHLARISYPGFLVLVSGEDERILQTVEKLANAHKLKVLGVLHKPVSLLQLNRVLINRLLITEKGARRTAKQYGPGELSQAIANNDLVNYYQPKVNVASGELVGVESLVRWCHPIDGLIPPDMFIPMAEENGLIDTLTHKVLCNALQQMRRWHDAGLHIHTAVNVSMKNLTRLDFPDMVKQAAREAGVPLTDLTLEVTESQLMQNVLVPLDILTRLRLKQIGLSIDDFGTGYSSLAQLHDIPFTELKIDKQFIHGAHQDASIRIIFEACLGMARQLDIKTVAEGVEDIDDWHFLRKSSCDLAQGYFIARPMPADNIVDWIPLWQARLKEFEIAGNG
jgi:EAL domain-containing protein (putative c-di-GMP-specific phosphodiesterase class I)/DNA-binding NarL/FixJ family response regulator